MNLNREILNSSPLIFFSLQITEYLDSLILTDHDIERIGDVFESEMTLALTVQNSNSSLQMENTYIPELPNGSGSNIGLFTNS